MPISDLKRDSRHALHEALAEPCLYHDRDRGPIPSAADVAEGKSLSVRFKSKLRTASAEADGLSILENVESLIFHDTQLAALALELEYGALIEIPGYGITFRLDQEMDRDGPLNVYWTVTRV